MTEGMKFRKKGQKVKKLLLPCCLLLFMGNVIGESAYYAQDTCGNAKIKGSYGFATTGSAPHTVAGTQVVFEPLNQVGLVAYDGAGAITLKMQVQFHGTLQPSATFSGTYTVASNCTGSAEFKNSSGATVYEWHFVVVHNADEIETMALVAAAESHPMFAMSFSQKKL